MLLARKSLQWGYKPILNALIRKYALKCFPSSNYQYSQAWNALYRHVKYKYGWDVPKRNTATNMIDRIKDNEFPYVIEVAAGLCEANNIDIGKTINGINAETIKKYERN